MMFLIRRVWRKLSQFAGSGPMSLWLARASKMPKTIEKYFKRNDKEEWELCEVVSKLGSQSNGRGFEACLFQILQGNGVKAMPGSIPVTLIPSSFRHRK